MPPPQAAWAGKASPQARIVFEVYVVASYYPDEGRSAGEGDDPCPGLPFRVRRTSPAVPLEAQAELRDRETYYAELRLAVQRQSRFFPRPRAALDDSEAETWAEDPVSSGYDDTWT
jgi:hypothetical protein